MSGALLRDLLHVLVEGARRAVRLRVEGRSTASGAAPVWVERAAEFEFTGAEAGSTCIVLEARSLAEADPERFNQREFFQEIDPSATGLQLFEDSAEDLLTGQKDSVKFDDGLIDVVENLRSVLRRGIHSVKLDGRRALRVDAEALDGVGRLRREIPRDHQVVVAGKLDQISHSDRAFRLLLEDGSQLQGLVPEDPDLLKALPAFWGNNAVVHGLAKFRPSGRVLRLEATAIEAANGDVRVWAEMPRPLVGSLDAAQLRVPQGARSGINAIVGQWPGEESDEEIRRALERLS
ncbi:MAG: hypothetical protein HUU15_07640 [Candidatus Brocadiae bacterium]|nr:hypothetical protein [Candidatus Brocadiia bacterium]